MHPRNLLRHPRRENYKQQKIAEHPSDRIWDRALLSALPTRVSSFSTYPLKKVLILIRAFLICWRRLIPAFPAATRRLWIQLLVFAQASILSKNHSIFWSLAAVLNYPHHELRLYPHCLPLIPSKRSAWRFHTF